VVWYESLHLEKNLRGLAQRVQQAQLLDHHLGYQAQLLAAVRALRRAMLPQGLPHGEWQRQHINAPMLCLPIIALSRQAQTLRTSITRLVKWCRITLLNKLLPRLTL
jgi:hypothetical protein